MSPFRASVPLTGTWEHFQFSVSDGIGTVTLDRPGKLNALTFEAYADLRDLLAELPHRGDTRVLVIRGNGRAFCSGGDVNEIIGATLAMSPDELLAFTRMSGEVIREMRDCPVPVIAAVHGMAAGAGAVIALAADFRVCTPAARFAFLFTKVGLSGGDMGAAYLLPRLVGLGHATRLLMLGDTVDAEEAERIGLVSFLAEKDAFDDEVIAARPAAGLRPGPGLRADQGPADQGAGHEPFGRDRARGDDPGPADEGGGLRRVPRGVQRGPPAAVDRPLRICSRRMSACPQCCANSRKACR